MSFIEYARSDARKVLQRLDPRFEPRVFFLVIRITPDASKPSHGVGPEDIPFSPADFGNVRTRAAELEKTDPEASSFWAPDPVHGWTDWHNQLQKRKERGIHCRALRKAVTEAANASPANVGFVTYCGWPVVNGDDDVLLLLQLQKDVHDTYYHLKRGTCTGRGGFHEYRRSRSLIDAVIHEYLAAMSDEIAKDHPRSGFSFIDDEDSLFLEAAKGLMGTPGRDAEMDEGLGGLFDACNALSTMKYEGKEGVGTLVFARHKHPHVREDISLISPMPLRSPGAVRKLLQMASGKLSLLSNGSHAYALGSVLPTYDLTAENVFTVHFTKQFAWELRHDSHPLMHVRYGVPSINLPGFPRERFCRDLPRVFPAINRTAINQLCEIAACAAEQPHGCMLVVSGDAANEAKRLASQCTRVEPFRMTKELIPHVTTIDGCVLVDTEGTCHAIGVILDGLASTKCSPERGSRYNSAVRYVYNRKDAVAIVKSEDGMISLFPDLMPQIRHREIRNVLQSLREASDALDPDRKILWDLMSWLHDHEFYLTAQECAEAERLHDAARAKIPEGEVHAEYSMPLTPHPDMNPSHYLPE